MAWTRQEVPTPLLKEREVLQVWQRVVTLGKRSSFIAGTGRGNWGCGTYWRSRPDVSVVRVYGAKICDLHRSLLGCTFGGFSGRLSTTQAGLWCAIPFGSDFPVAGKDVLRFARLNPTTWNGGTGQRAYIARWVPPILDQGTLYR